MSEEDSSDSSTDEESDEDVPNGGEQDEMSSRPSESVTTMDATAERRAHLSILKKIIGENRSDTTNLTTPEVSDEESEPDEEDEDEGERHEEGVDQDGVRQEGVSSEAESSSTEGKEGGDGGNDSSSSSTISTAKEDEQDGGPAPAAGKDESKARQAEVQMTSLTAMFKPHEAEGTSSISSSSRLALTHGGLSRRFFSWWFAR
jgi:hypothetical protein